MERPDDNATDNWVIHCASCGAAELLDQETRTRLLQELENWDRRFDLAESILANVLRILGFSQKGLPTQQAQD